MNSSDTPLARPLRQFCAAVGISPTTAYEEIRAGRLIVAKIGTRTLVPHDRGVEWLKGREVATLAPPRNPNGRRGSIK